MGFRKKLKKRSQPEVRAIGKDPSEGDADFPDLQKLKPGSKISVTINKEDKNEEKLKWDIDRDGPEMKEDDDDCFFSICGNFNDWEDDRMAAGDVPGVHTATIEVPDSGILEWRFLKDGDKDLVLAPATAECSTKTEAIQGPAKGLANKWVVRSQPGSEVKIELFYMAGMRSVLWLGAVAGGE